MRSLLLASGVLLMLAAFPARAGRALTEEESAKLSSAMSAEGCSGGDAEFDDGKYEINDAKCGDGRTYELEFDMTFQMIKKDLED